jgi:hypothetical protein
MALNRLLGAALLIGAASAMLAPPLRAAGLTPEQDFAARSSAPGVLRAEGFDSAAAVAAHVFPDGRFELSGSGYDANVHASGGGSLHFVVPSLSASNTSGAWTLNFSDALDVGIGAGDDVYIQWRERFDSNMLNTRFAGSEGWKQIIVGEGDTPGQQPVNSCTELELVMQNQDLDGFPIMYHNCGVYQGFYEAFGAYDFKLQNQMPSPYCLFSNHAGCFMYSPNEWMTFQIHIKPGPRGTAASTLEDGKTVTGFTNSVVEFWVAREGQPSVLALSWSGVVLHETAGKTYGKLWLLPFQTNKDATVSNPVANIWYDELIISRQKIADPGTSAVRPQPPTNVKAN